MRRTIALLCILLWNTVATAHPFSQEEYSLRTAVTVSEKGIVPLVVLEVPIPIALQQIGATTEDPRDVKKRKIKAYNEKQWNALADNLIYTVDGKAVQGEWLAINHPANGKAAEGFFVYMVSFNYKKAPALQNNSTITIENQTYPETKMVYSGSVTVKEPWNLVSSTTNSILGENETADLSDPNRWSTNSELRTITAVISK
jgi:hypothetical protein